MGRSECGEDPRFNTLVDRKGHEKEVDEMVGGWTTNLPPEEVMARLQGAGVPAGRGGERGRPVRRTPS